MADLVLTGTPHADAATRGGGEGRKGGQRTREDQRDCSSHEAEERRRRRAQGVDVSSHGDE